jgi:hypothetical protein
MSRTQFSLRTLLAAVAAVGIGTALWTAEPSWQVGAVELSLLGWGLASATILIANSAGMARAFWLGCTVEFVLPAILHVGSTNYSSLTLNWHFESFLWNLSSQFRTVLLFWAFSPVVGLLCVFTHWLLIRPPQGPQD